MASRSLRRALRIWESWLCGRLVDGEGTNGGAGEDNTALLLGDRADDGVGGAVAVFLSVIVSRPNCFWRPSRSPASVQKARYRSAILA